MNPHFLQFTVILINVQNVRGILKNELEVQTMAIYIACIQK